MRRVITAITLITLSSCGGGGSSSPPPSQNQPTVTLDSTSLGYQALYVENYPITVTPAPTAFTFANFVAAPNVKVSAPTTGGIDTISFTMADATHGGITLTLKAPSQLAQSTYQTPITVKVYSDSTGDNLVQSFTVTLSYTVTDSFTVSGANGYTITALPVATQGLAGNAKQNAVYADVLTDSATNAYSVEALDPASGASLYPPVPDATPAVLALSDDGQFLYAEVASGLEQLAASSLALTLALPVTAEGVAVAPGMPHTVAVASSSALQIFDDAVARANSVAGSQGSYSYLQWGSASAVYANTAPGSVGPPYTVCAYAVNSAGVTATGSCGPANIVPNIVTFANGLGYAYGGAIVNPATWTVVQTLSVPQGNLGTVTPDTTLGLAFAYVTGTQGGCWIQSFDLSTGAAVASVRLPTVSAGNSDNTCHYADSAFGTSSGMNSLARFAANGIAIGTDIRGQFVPGYLIVITGAFVAQ